MKFPWSVCLLDLNEVLQASILGCRTEFLAEVKVGNSHLFHN